MIGGRWTGYIVDGQVKYGLLEVSTSFTGKSGQAELGPGQICLPGLFCKAWAVCSVGAPAASMSNRSVLPSLKHETSTNG